MMAKNFDERAKKNNSDAEESAMTDGFFFLAGENKKVLADGSKLPPGGSSDRGDSFVEKTFCELTVNFL